MATSQQFRSNASCVSVISQAVHVHGLGLQRITVKEGSDGL